VPPRETFPMQNSQQGWFLVEFVIRFVRKKINVIRLLGLHKTKKKLWCDEVHPDYLGEKKVHPDFQRAEKSNLLKTGPFQVSGNLFRPNHWPWNSSAERFELWVSQELVATWNHRYSDLFVECHKPQHWWRSRLVTHMPRLPQDCHHCKLVVLYLLITFNTLLQPQYQSGKRLMWQEMDQASGWGSWSHRGDRASLEADKS